MSLLARMYATEVPKPPGSVLAVSYGGGVNSVAALVFLARHNLRPAAIVMADPGSERRKTEHFRDVVLPPWLDAHGFPRVTVIDRITEGEHIKRAWRLETLRDECLRTESLPSVAYGWKKCSAKYKGDTQRWWIRRQHWAIDTWARGERVVKVIGYDFDEGSRVRAALPNAWEAARLVPWYPLVDACMSREDCEAMILDAGLPLPGKSACTFCPNNTLKEWEELRRDEPDRFAEAVGMSRNAKLDSPDVVGLMRCNPHGKRQLHIWADGGYELEGCGNREDPMPCECAL